MLSFGVAASILLLKIKKIQEEEKVQYNGVRGLTMAPRLKTSALYSYE